MASFDHLSAARLKTHIDAVELSLRRIGAHAEYAAEILRYGAFIGSEVHCHASLDRTMVRARREISQMEQAGRSIRSGTTIIAASLTGSKGRFTRHWHAPPGGLWGTVILVNTLLPRFRNLLPQAVGVACCEAVHRYGVPATIRWINDVLVDGRKIAGFLCESFIGERSGEEYCLLGFGINVNNEQFPHELRDSAASVSMLAGKSVDLTRFACDFLAALTFQVGLLHHHEARVLRQETEEYPHPLLLLWRELSDSIGRPVVYGFDVVARPQYRAHTVEVTNDGGLCLRLEDGREIVEYSGEIRYL